MVAARFLVGLALPTSLVLIAWSEFRTLSIAVMVSGPMECERRARSYSVMGNEAERFGSPSLPLLSAEGSYGLCVSETVYD